MVKAYLKGNSKLSTAKERIRRWLTEGDIVLQPDEITILQRLEFADRLMSQGITVTGLLRKQIMDEFGVSQSTADGDIFNAQEIFGESRKINKRYLGHLHLQDIHADLTRIRKKLFEDKNIPDQKEMQALARLHDSYTYQLNSLPDTDPPPAVKRPIFVFMLPQGHAPKAPMELTDAMAKADEFINYELLPNGKIEMENGTAEGKRTDIIERMVKLDPSI